MGFVPTPGNRTAKRVEEEVETEDRRGGVWINIQRLYVHGVYGEQVAVRSMPGWRLGSVVDALAAIASQADDTVVAEVFSRAGTSR